MSSYYFLWRYLSTSKLWVIDCLGVSSRYPGSLGVMSLLTSRVSKGMGCLKKSLEGS